MTKDDAIDEVLLWAESNRDGFGMTPGEFLHFCEACEIVRGLKDE